MRRWQVVGHSAVRTAYNLTLLVTREQEMSSNWFAIGVKDIFSCQNRVDLSSDQPDPLVDNHKRNDKLFSVKEKQFAGFSKATFA